ncbi:BQ2448_2970 [Microbotryum intermedium]|uniref:BQ2448_2970 protein n=1 Tax=Microbotryum intermedium TaxID=269621 RepID=A0A238FC09_9BASI|nr:BQ2448_2970 [Microbotryum intermedium]
MLLSFSHILVLGASFCSLQAVIAAPTPGSESVEVSATAKWCKSNQYFNKPTKSCLTCTSKFTNALTCTDSEATSCSRGKLEDGKCQLKTTCSGPRYVSPQDGFTCIACPDSKASRCDDTGKSVACNAGTPVNGNCAPVKCTGATYPAANGKTCTRCPDKNAFSCNSTQSLECNYGVVTKGKCVAFKCPDNTANTADGKLKSYSKGQDHGTACCSDIYTAVCAPSLAPLRCKPDAILNTIGNHCVLPVAVSQYGSESPAATSSSLGAFSQKLTNRPRFSQLSDNTSKQSGVTPTGGYPVTYMQWGSNPVNSYDTCASFAAKQSPSNDRGQTLFFWNGSTCWVQSRSSYVSKKFAKGSYSLNIFGHCRNTAKSAPATDAFEHGIDCGDVTAKI